MFENLSLNARMWIAALATALVASGVGLAIALTVPSGSGRPQALLTPAPTETPLVEPSESPLATESPTPSVSPSPSASPSASPVSSAAAVRDPKDVSCVTEPKLCSNVTGMMTVKDGKLTTRQDVPSGTDYSGSPETKMTSTVLRPNQTPAKTGDQVGWIKVHVDVVNNTNRTFVFPQRKVALVVTHNSKEDVNETNGPYTEVPPGGALHADFLNPEVADGSYAWRVKVWFYAK